MIYHRFYHAEYRDDTRRLTMLEHGAYRLLLDAYYSDEKPFHGTRKETGDETREETREETYRLAGAFTDAERAAVDKVLRLFFTLEADGCWHNARADVEIAKYNAALALARENGRKGGRPRKTAEPETKPATKPAGKPAAKPAEEPGNNHPLNHSTVSITPSVAPREREALSEPARLAFDALAGDRAVALAGLLRGITQGMHGPAYSWAQVSRALVEYHANESGKFSARHFKGYLERDARGGAARPGTNGHGSRQANNVAAISEWLGREDGE